MKELKEQIIEALQDAIDTETGQVSISYFDALLDGILTEALRIHDVVGRSEQLVCPKCGSDDIGDDVKDEKAKYCFSCKSWLRAK